MAQKEAQSAEKTSENSVRNALKLASESMTSRDDETARDSETEVWNGLSENFNNASAGLDSAIAKLKSTSASSEKVSGVESEKTPEIAVNNTVQKTVLSEKAGAVSEVKTNTNTGRIWIYVLSVIVILTGIIAAGYQIVRKSRKN